MKLFLFAGCVWLSCAITVGAQDNFVQDRFAIGLWVDPPLDERAEARYKELSEANFTMVIGGFGGDAQRAKQVDLCTQYDLKLIVSDRTGDVASLPNGPTVWGYALRDEPSATDFPALAKRAEEVRKHHPGKLSYINLFPDYANAEQLGTETYDDHVRLFMETIQPGVLSMDHYPIFKPDGDGRDKYCVNLESMRKHSLKADVPFWNFFNTMPYGPHTDPTEGQLRWQINASLAYGAKGVMYFCYNTPGGKEFPKGGAIIRRDGRRTRHYYEAQRINAELKNLGPTLMKLTSTRIVRVNEAAGDMAADVLVGMPILNLERDKVDPTQDYLVGNFVHEDGRRGVLLQNYRFAYTAWPTVLFDAPLHEVLEVDPKTGKEVPVLDDSPIMDGLQVSLGAGDARLFLLP